MGEHYGIWLLINTIPYLDIRQCQHLYHGTTTRKACLFNQSFQIDQHLTPIFSYLFVIVTISHSRLWLYFTVVKRLLKSIMVSVAYYFCKMTTIIRTIMWLKDTCIIVLPKTRISKTCHLYGFEWGKCKRDFGITNLKKVKGTVVWPCNIDMEWLLFKIWSKGVSSAKN